MVQSHSRIHHQQRTYNREMVGLKDHDGQRNLQMKILQTTHVVRPGKQGEEDNGRNQQHILQKS